MHLSKKNINAILLLILLTNLLSSCTTEIKKIPTVIKNPEENIYQKINWVDFDKSFSKAQENNKYIMLSFYVDWCQYCKRLNTVVYLDDKLSKYLNEKFISVKINAESDEIVTFRNQKISKRNLAKVFGATNYPDIFFMENEDKILAKIQGLQEAKEFYVSASYIGNNAYKSITLEEHKERIEILEY